MLCKSDSHLTGGFGKSYLAMPLMVFFSLIASTTPSSADDLQSFDCTFTAYCTHSSECDVSYVNATLRKTTQAKSWAIQIDTKEESMISSGEYAPAIEAPFEKQGLLLFFSPTEDTPYALMLRVDDAGYARLHIESFANALFSSMHFGACYKGPV